MFNELFGVLGFVDGVAFALQPVAVDAVSVDVVASGDAHGVRRLLAMTGVCGNDVNDALQSLSVSSRWL